MRLTTVHMWHFPQFQDDNFSSSFEKNSYKYCILLAMPEKRKIAHPIIIPFFASNITNKPHRGNFNLQLD